MATNEQESKSLWHHGWDSLMSDRTTVIAMSIVLIYSVVALLSATGLIVSDWSKEVGPSYAPPSSEFLFGLDIFGRSVFAKTVKATEIAMSVGLARCYRSSTYW